MIVWFVLAFTVCLTGVAQICLKFGVLSLVSRLQASTGPLDSVLIAATEWRLIGALGLYGVATITWLYVLSRLPLSVAYPFVGLSFISVLVMSVLFLGEKVVPLQVCGTLCVAVGVVLVAISSRPPAPAPVIVPQTAEAAR
ncbi:EamA family transporter [Sphingomonas immobilis]|uniref:EamA family transporter n=1 Tax=Sphingomonas immobilis TaxID=3063997 RepID=A0ABT9A442_9SPHN|nr:EamA family transporter [Sphingomonas sp. CA1-15]MDO7844617.1 EamA family transporter [Sphingomonas sp. CA1-15]